MAKAKVEIENASRSLGRGIDKKLNKRARRAKHLLEKASRKEIRMAKEAEVAYDKTKKVLKRAEKAKKRAIKSS